MHHRVPRALQRFNRPLANLPGNRQSVIPKSYSEVTLSYWPHTLFFGESSSLTEPPYSGRSHTMSVNFIIINVSLSNCLCENFTLKIGILLFISKGN